MGWMFAGKSGAGKSTIAQIFHQKKNGLILSDDRVVVRQIGNDFVMHGSPWPGDAGFAENRSAFINGIVFLRKGSKNQIVEISSTDALSRLMPVISIPWYDKEKVEKMMAFCEIFIKKIPMYELTFRADDSVADYMEMFINAKKAID
jgi:serine kinase of HPr protein (carbohydrate metabolism regulator)